MKIPPTIVVQLVHIEGPLKGQIQEFPDPVVTIGRHPSSHVQFPTDLTIISRKHAEIVREGNRFKLVDQSTNGTFVNGKRVQEAYLKDGDVLAFAEGGPKVSFLTNVMEGQPPLEVPPPQGVPAEPSGGPQPIMQPPPAPQRPADRGRVVPSAPPGIQPTAPPAERGPVAQRPAGPEVPIRRVQAPLVIQYGPTLRSFKELPVTIGRSPGCEFFMEHPSILDRHAQIFFHGDQYWVKDLTGQNLLSVNGMPIAFQAPLQSDDTLALSPQGPRFRFLGGGRLAEIEEVAPKQAPEPPTPQPTGPSGKQGDEKGLKGAKAIFQKFLRR